MDIYVYTGLRFVPWICGVWPRSIVYDDEFVARGALTQGEVVAATTVHCQRERKLDSMGARIELLRVSPVTRRQTVKENSPVHSTSQQG